jgi:hypothetical protein
LGYEKKFGLKAGLEIVVTGSKEEIYDSGDVLLN